MKNKIRKIFSITLVVLIWVIIMWFVIKQFKESSIENRQAEYETQNLSGSYTKIEKNEINNNILINYEKEEVISKYKGYNVLAKMEIPKIKLKTYILEECTEKSLNKAVAKFWGANPNEEGNLCVAGHNAPRNSNMFYKLKNLEVGDEFTISDNKIGKVPYEIYDIYKVSPKDVSCISQNTNGNKEVTLITCTNDSKKRFIVKAKEKIN